MEPGSLGEGMRLAADIHASSKSTHSCKMIKPGMAQYAQWEESQKDYRRARSVWERALDVSYASVTLWLKYAEMEMRARFVNHARNVWDRAVTLLPRIDQLWYKYIHMEEMLNNVPGARQTFERWMQWEPDHHGWAAYIKVSTPSVRE